MVLWFVMGPDSPFNEGQFTEVLLFVKERKVDETSFVRKILIVKTSKRLNTLHSNISFPIPTFNTIEDRFPSWAKSFPPRLIISYFQLVFFVKRAVDTW